MDAQSTSHEELPVRRDENPSPSLLCLVIEGRQGRGAIAHRRRDSRGVLRSPWSEEGEGRQLRGIRALPTAKRRVPAAGKKKRRHRPRGKRAPLGRRCVADREGEGRRRREEEEASSTMRKNVVGIAEATTHKQ
jgi:hypothetical protein